MLTHGHTAGGENGYTLQGYAAGGENGYTLLSLLLAVKPACTILLVVVVKVVESETLSCASIDGW
jgi:hypothetical protein